jgi:glycosyltransferase involved in cell wall biosynthesis
MIVKNEEATLPKCLGSVQSVVDEIVVLDTGSGDRTPFVAQEFGAKVYYSQWQNDFSHARNEALNYVTGDWVLVLDADEALTSEIIPQIKAAITREEYILINLVRQEIGATQSPYSLVSRLFRNHPNVRFDRPYHALVDDSVSKLLAQQPDWQIGYLPGVAILHTGYQKARIKSQNKSAKAAAAMAEFAAHNPYDPYVCSKLGALYVDMGKINQGMELLNRGVNSILGDRSISSPKQSTNSMRSQELPKSSVLDQIPLEINYDILYELYYHLGITHAHLNNFSRAIDYYQAAIKLPIYPLLKLGAYNNLGNLLKESGDLQGARIAYETAIKIDPNFVPGYYNLGMLLKSMGLFAGAIAAYNQAIRLKADYPEAYQNLGVVLLKVGDTHASIAAFTQAIALHELDNPEEAHRLRQGLQGLGLI